MDGKRPGRWAAAIGAIVVLAGVAALFLNARVERGQVDLPSVAAPSPQADTATVAPPPPAPAAEPPVPPPKTAPDVAKTPEKPRPGGGGSGHGAAKKQEPVPQSTPTPERSVPTGLAERDLDLYLAHNPPAAGANALDRWLKDLDTASYAFNTPSPVKVDEPFQVQAAIAPGLTQAELREQLSAKLARPGDKVSSGAVLAAPRMRAVLDGGGEFDISMAAGSSDIREVSGSLQAVWSWNVSAREPGKARSLALSFYVVPPGSVSPDPIAIKVLNRMIDVDVTYPWLVDHYWDKYWKWLIGGVASVISAWFAWWWKRHFSTPAGP